VALAQTAREGGGIDVAGGFTGGDQHVHGGGLGFSLPFGALHWCQFMPAKNGRVRHEAFREAVNAAPVAEGRTPVEAFAQPLWPQTTPLGTHFSYLAAGVKLQEDELKDYLEEPIAAIPASILAALPPVHVVFVPFLELDNGQVYVTNQRPAKRDTSLAVAQVENQGRSMLLFGMQEPDLGDFHYHFFRAVGILVSHYCDAKGLAGFSDLVLAELNEPVHGEVDEQSWQQKQDLFERHTKLKQTTKGVREYLLAAYRDTLTLYLHGICCDIDVEPGPRQLPSRPLRKRLEYLEGTFPPPDGYAVFPEDGRPAGKK